LSAVWRLTCSSNKEIKPGPFLKPDCRQKRRGNQGEDNIEKPSRRSGTESRKKRIRRSIGLIIQNYGAVVFESNTYEEPCSVHGLRILVRVRSDPPVQNL